MPLIPLCRIEPDPENVRDDEGDVSELVASIRATGLINPLTVYPSGTAQDLYGAHSRYRLSAGHRRRKALAVLAVEDPYKWSDVECNIVNPPADDLERLDRMIAENVHREQLNPVEEARAYARYRDAGLSQPQIAERTSRSQPVISTALLWLDTLSPEELEQLSRGQMTRGKATELVKARRIESGAARTDIGGKHRFGYQVPWFTLSHPRGRDVQDRCRLAGHDPRVRIGPGCGPCWEAVLGGGAVTSGWRAQSRYDPPTPYGEQRGELVTRAQDLAELSAIAGGVRESVMTATPERIRRLLERAFARLTESVKAQAAADERERRSLVQAVEDLTDVFTDDTAPEPTAATG